MASRSKRHGGHSTPPAAPRTIATSASSPTPTPCRQCARFATRARCARCRTRIWSKRVHVDVLFDPFEGSWAELRAGALAAEQAGFDGVWLYDHLAGSVHGASRVVECWTILTAIAATV